MIPPTNTTCAICKSPLPRLDAWVQAPASIWGYQAPMRVCAGVCELAAYNQGATCVGMSHDPGVGR